MVILEIEIEGFEARFAHFEHFPKTVTLHTVSDSGENRAEPSELHT